MIDFLFFAMKQCSNYYKLNPSLMYCLQVLVRFVVHSVAIFTDLSKIGRFFTLAADKNFGFQIADFKVKNS